MRYESLKFRESRKHVVVATLELMDPVKLCEGKEERGKALDDQGSNNCEKEPIHVHRVVMVGTTVHGYALSPTAKVDQNNHCPARFCPLNQCDRRPQ
jgi:hypothetical protein